MACRRIHCCLAGQFRGRWTIRFRDREASRPGTPMMVVAMVAIRAFPIPAACAAARERLNASTAQTSQAMFALKLFEGRWASGPPLSSAMTCSTIAWPRWRRSASTAGRVELVMKA